MISAIAHHYFAVNRLYAGLSERGIADAVPAAQIELETDLAKALQSPLEAYYEAPFKRGYGSVPTKSQAAIEDWLTVQYEANPQWSSGLITTMLPFLKDGTAEGIAQGLELLHGPDSTIELTDDVLLADITDHVSDLMTVNADVSLAQTTIQDIARAIFRATAADIAISVALAALAGHILARSILIAETEISRSVTIGLVETYGRNGIVHMIYNTRDSDACKRCTPDNGKQFIIPPAIWLPRHPHCRCYYLPDMKNWNPPNEWWIGA